MISTVTGPLDPSAAGVTDAHQHIWIAPPAGSATGVPALCDRAAITAGLVSYRAAGGGSLLDCQPGGCGRDGRMLLTLSRASETHIVACTGFHLPRYYPPDYWLWRASAEAARAYFVGEITVGLAETRDTELTVRAGFIKIACTSRLDETPAALWMAAATASRETGAALLVHTDAGAGAEQIAGRLLSEGVDAGRLVLCHVDKRPDIGLHRELAQAGVLLEYDTFYRPKYQPERHVWPLLERMVADDLAGQVAIGTDMADSATWREYGPARLPGEIVPRLRALGCDPPTVRRLTGENIAHSLSL